MARYITELANDIAKSCPDLVENGCGNDNCVACLAFKLIGLGYKKQPNTAEVVPKSEVKALKNQVNRLQKYAAKRDEKLNALLVAKTKQEVAREIFEEIYETMNSVYASVQRSCVGMHGDNPETMRLLGKLEGVKRLGDEIAELKKKYTKGEHDEQI